MASFRNLAVALAVSAPFAATAPVSAESADDRWATEETRTPAGYALCRLTRTNAEGDALALHVLPGRKISMDFVDADVGLAPRYTSVSADFSVSASNEVVTRDVSSFGTGERGLKFLFPVEDNEMEGLFMALAASETATFSWKNPLGGSALGEFTIALGDTEAAMSWLAGCIERAPAVNPGD